MSNFFTERAKKEIKLAALEEEDDRLLNSLFDKDYIKREGIEVIRDLAKKIQRSDKLSGNERLFIGIALRSMYAKLSIIKGRRELDETSDNGD